MRGFNVALAALALGALGALAGCGAGDSSDNSYSNTTAGGGSVVTTSTSRTYETVPTPTSEPDVRTAPSCSEGSLENCYTRAEMRDLIDVFLPYVEEFFDTRYANMPVPSGYIYVAAGESGQGGCNDGYDGETLAYCPADQKIYLGQSAVWTLYDSFGDAAPVLVIAHEWTHHVQHQTGVPMGDTRAPNSIIPSENQADCGAGAFMNYADQQGWLEYPDDLQDIGGALRAAGDLEGPDRTHGTIQERIQSFSIGFTEGLWACNRFAPYTPIIS
jgi:predicted metalloprotease